MKGNERDECLKALALSAYNARSDAIDQGEEFIAYIFGVALFCVLQEMPPPGRKQLAVELEL